MGEDIYVAYWQSVLPNIIEQLKKIDQVAQLEISGLAQYGQRESYYSNFKIDKGVLVTPDKAKAPGRDFYKVLAATDYFKQNLFDSSIQITITKDFIIKMEILEPAAPEFFTEEDFEQLMKFSGTAKISGNQEHQKVYDNLRGTYAKTAYWARQVQQKLFATGKVHLIQKPTNQANNFEYYQWAKIFPDKETADLGLLSYTVTIDTEEQFVVKIDTIGLNEGDERRQKYLKFRGDYYNSPIVKIFQTDQILDKGWKYLIDLSANAITDLKADFDQLLQSIQGVNRPLNVNRPEEKNTISLNTILYGPPGTGKTYHSINRALSIIDGEQKTRNLQAEKGREAITERFEELKNLGLIEFITFHQNYSYEEFVQGLRPKIEGANQLLFEKRDGIFKKIADKALENFNASSAQEVTIEPAFDEVFDDFFKPLIDETGPIAVQMESPGYQFYLTKYNPEANNFSFEKQSKISEHNIYIPTLRKYFEEPGIDHIQGLKSYYKPLAKALLSRASQLRKVVRGQERNKYVLIIDEINRANISRVFGELITLLEEDKRWGRKHKMKTRLPSGDEFTIPANLYIIGTMNTADKSIALLDIALRRRFDFIPMYPDSEINGVQYPDILEKINEQVLIKRGADFLIGHSYFMKDEFGQFNLQEAMNSRIIPLLSEYFYNQKGDVVKTIISEAIAGTTMRVDYDRYKQLKFSMT